MLFSRAWGKMIHEKNLKQKISWQCPFKGPRHLEAILTRSSSCLFGQSLKSIFYADIRGTYLAEFLACMRTTEEAKIDKSPPHPPFRSLVYNAIMQIKSVKKDCIPSLQTADWYKRAWKAMNMDAPDMLCLFNWVSFHRPIKIFLQISPTEPRALKNTQAQYVILPPDKSISLSKLWHLRK